jgi:RRXRR protein
LAILVLAKPKKPLMPCSENRARLLLTPGRAVVHRRHPFTIRLRDRVGGDVQPVRVKIDPGSKATGVAIITDDDRPAKVLCLFKLAHRGRRISEAVTARRAFRREVGEYVLEKFDRACAYCAAAAGGLQRGRLG